MESKIIILGAGVSGLTMKNEMDDALIIEKNEFAGGLCHTFRFDEFHFDCTGHYLHSDKSKDKELKKKMKKIKRKAKIFIENRFIDYPFQTHFHSLKKNTVKECIEGFMDRDKTKEVKNLKDWVMKYYGKGIGEHFMFPYNEKLWRTPSGRISYDWMSSFIPNLTDDEVLHGGKSSVGYNSFFHYPKSPGFDNILKFNDKDINLKEKAVKIDVSKKILYTDKSDYKYDFLASSIPLPELMKLTGNPVNGLEYTSVYNVNLAVKGESPADFHWVYVPENKYRFYRVGIPSNANKLMCPKGHYLLSAEISYRGKRNLKYEEIIESLKSMKLLKDKKKIVMRFDIDIKYAYVIYNMTRKDKVESCVKYLSEKSIYTTGRYGLWEYSFVSQDIINAIKTAKAIKEKTKWRV